VPKQITLSDVRIREMRWSEGMADGSGNPVVRLAGVFLDENGGEVGTWHDDLAMDSTMTFTALLGYTLGPSAGDVVRGPDGKTKAANDHLGAGFGEFMKAFVAAKRQKEGI
jgi:hypothetical protein